MKKEKALEHIEKKLMAGDELIGFFMAQTPIKFWLFFVIGPLAALSLKQYFIATTRKGMYFHKLSMLGKFPDESDFFAFDEIEKVKIGKGTLQRPMHFYFKNGGNLKVKALLKGVKSVAKLTDDVQTHIQSNIAAF